MAICWCIIKYWCWSLVKCRMLCNPLMNWTLKWNFDIFVLSCFVNCTCESVLGEFHNSGRTFWAKIHSLSWVPGKPTYGQLGLKCSVDSYYIRQYTQRGYRYLLQQAVHTLRTSCSVANSCLGKSVQKLVTDVHLVYLIWNDPLACCYVEALTVFVSTFCEWSHQ